MLFIEFAKIIPTFVSYTKMDENAYYNTILSIINPVFHYRIGRIYNAFLYQSWLRDV